MNCDDAFDRMTSPGANGDPALQAHLRSCPRCRDMQQTLSPAMEWLASFDDPDCTSQRAAPLLTDEALRVAERAARRLGRPRVASDAPRGMMGRFGSWIFVAGVATLVFFAVLFPPSARRTALPKGTASTACLWSAPLNERALVPPTADQVIATCAACHLPPP
jgi:hypothetical protein